MCEKEIFYRNSCLFYTENSRFSNNRPTWVLGRYFFLKKNRPTFVLDRKSATVGSATVGTSPVVVNDRTRKVTIRRNIYPVGF